MLKSQNKLMSPASDEESNSKLFSNNSLNLKKIRENLLNDSRDDFSFIENERPDHVDSTANYKLVSAKDEHDNSKNQYFIVPRESFIKNVLHSFNQNHPTAKKESVTIEGFDGIIPSDSDDSEEEVNDAFGELSSEQVLETLRFNPEELNCALEKLRGGLKEDAALEEELTHALSGKVNSAISDGNNDASKAEPFEQFLKTHTLNPREVNFQTLLELDIFSGMGCTEIPEMQNGHVSSRLDRVHRILIVRHTRHLGLIGAIYFEIDLSDQLITVHACAVSNKEQAKGLGSFLLESALLISMLYGVENVCLETTGRGITLYTKHGFYMDYTKDNKSWRLKNAKDILEAQLEINDEPLLELSIPDSFNTLRSLISLPELTQERYDEFKQWKDFEEVLTKNKGKILSRELNILKKHLKIPAHILEQLEENQVKPLVDVGKKRRYEAETVEELELKKIRLSKYNTTDALKLYSIFTSPRKSDEYYYSQSMAYYNIK